MNKYIRYFRFKLASIVDSSVFNVLRHFTWILPGYRIKGCITYNHGDLVAMKLNYIAPGAFQEYYNSIVNEIEDSLKNNRPLSVIRSGDGEAYFLQEKYIGNIVKRHLTTKDNNVDTNFWVSQYLANDIITYDANLSLRRLWVPIVGTRVMKNYNPLHVVYAIVANRDIFSIVKDKKIGLIGSKEKLNMISELMKHKQYRDYIKLSEIQSYIGIPNTGACNYPNKLLNNIIKEAVKNPCDIYFVAAGISKIYFMSELRDKLNCIVIDIGSGMDALAGIIPKDRPYFGNWVNYKIKKNGSDSDSRVDILSTKSRSLYKYKTNNDVIL
jgi:hypothetical protein